MTAVLQTIPASQISDQCISPQFVLKLLMSAGRDPESNGFVMLLMKQSFEVPLTLVKEYLGDPKRLDGGTIGEPFLQPAYVQALGDALARSLALVASVSTTGTPRRFHLVALPVTFKPSSWWTRDAPALPLDSFLLWARNVAWYLYWFAEHGDKLDKYGDVCTTNGPTGTPSGFGLF